MSLMRILIVDDDFSNLRLLKALLEKTGHETDSAQNGEEALKKLRSEKFDLIISDILMPIMDGYKLTQMCKQDETLRHIPVIICTGTYINDKDAQIAMKFGAEAYLKKPFDHKSLTQTIDTVIDNIRSGKIKTAESTEPEDSGVYKLYSERLVNKLEKKMEDLDKEKMALEMEVAERKKIEDRLRKSRDFAESLFKTAPAIVLILDTEGRILRFNPYMGKISGYAIDEVQGKQWSDVFSPENGRGNSINLSTDVDETLSAAGNISSIRTKAGDRREIIWYDRPLKDNDGKITGLLAIGQDITEQLDMQRNLFRAKKFEAIGSFAGGIAYDFNSLLTLILGNISLLEKNIQSGSDTSECMAEARNAALRAREMASRIMLFSRDRDPVKQSFSIGPLILEAVKSAIWGFKIHSEFDIPDDLYPAEIDPWLMKHAFHNVALNAVEAMEGSGHIHVTCENVEITGDNSFKLSAGPYVKITIRDQGPGIAREQLERVFDPDFSTKNTGIFKGLGLGLSIVYSIIKKHQGVIEVTAEPGSGTVVNMYLPASQETAASLETREPTGLRAKKTGSGKKILVMNDEEPLRQMFKKMLNWLGYNPMATATRDKTVKAYRESAESGNLFHAVILDMTHKFSIVGEQTIAELRKINPDVKIIICTAYPHDPIIADFKVHGFRGVLIKPFTIDDLGFLLADIFREEERTA